MSGLPRGWERAAINDFATQTFDGPFGSNLKSADYTSDGVRVVRLENIGLRRFVLEKRTFVSIAKFKQLARHELRADDVLVSSFIDDAVRACLMPHDLEHAAINKADVFCIRVNAASVSPRYLMYRLSAADTFGSLSANIHGATRPRIGLRDLQAVQVEVPPTAEQRRIVAKIDSLSARSEGARAELAKAVELGARAKLRLLDMAFKGDLTADWRNDRKLTDWRHKPFKEWIADGPSNGWSPPSGGDATGALTLKLTATTSGQLRLDSEATKRIFEMPAEDSRFWLKPNDILIQRANTIEYVGTASIFDGPSRTYIYPDLMMRVRLVDAGWTRFVWLYLNSPAARGYFKARATGTAGNMPKINGETVRNLPLPFPHPTERDELVRRIERAFAAIDRLAAEADSARALLDKLDAAILAKAFRGELVPQDPDDEPASVLLERIRAERAAAPAPKRKPRAKRGEAA